MTDASRAKKLARLEQLSKAYGAELPQRLAAIDASWNNVRSAADPVAPLESLLNLVHSLAGSAGTFGYESLGRKARALELALGSLRAEGVAPGPEQRASLDSWFAALPELANQQRLPAAYGQAEPEPEPEQDASEGEPGLLYVIEDDQAQAEDLASQLRIVGWRVETFVSTAAARLALLQEEPPAALIIDVMLPEGPYAGKELVSLVQAKYQVRLPHVVVSTQWDWDSRLAAARSGAEGYFVKPLDFAALADRLDSLTNRLTQPPYRVLVVDDTALLAERYTQVLVDVGMQARALMDPSHLLETLTDFSPELILMDLHMPQCNGIEAARVIRQDPKFTGVPIVFLSTESGRQQQLTAMRTGADDFLEKPISDADLVTAVSVRAERFRTVASLIRQDSLTGLINHMAIKQQLDTEIARAERSGSPFAVVMIDIDHFKRVNDSYGHPAGDRVIRALAQLLRRRLRRSDIVGRYGGEEFVVVLPDTPPQAALQVIDAARTLFGQLRFKTGEQEFSCSFSAGLASFATHEDASLLLHSADEALYEAKRSGRNRVCQFHAPA